ncbi:MAG: UDP-N-acetylmuramoyl-L-alanyl-D-glutamate--2,6-diaminopimelate ligase, partial [Oscillospiraceae bacterium]
SIFNRMVKAGCEFAVMEVSSHALAQQRTAGCHFECGVFTNLTQDHLDYHKTMEEYYKAKKLLFDSSDFAILNYDDSYSKRLMQEIKIPYLTYSASADLADYTAKAVRGMPTGSRFTFIGKDTIGRISFPMPGSYSVSNAMATAATAIKLGCDVPSVCKALTACPGVKGRTEVIPVDAEFAVIRDYAHTPDGLEKVITALKQFSVGRVITLFGCAGERDRTKRNKMSEIVSRLSDLAILTSDNPRSENPQQIIDDAMDGLAMHNTPYKIFIDRYEAIVWAVAECKKDDILLLAGKGHEDYQVLDFGTVNFDEKAIIQQLLKKK